MVEDKITKEKIAHYNKLTSTALKEIPTKINKGKEKEAKEIIEMATNYLKDSEHFEKKGNYINAYGALNYAHGWIDAGVRLEIFNVTNRELYTIK